MESDGSITRWIVQLKAGEQTAAQPIWEAYFRRLVGLARKKLDGTPKRVADEEDVALSAFDSFCRGAERGKFPLLHDRDDLWHLLVVITARKAVDLTEFENRAKRGGDVVFSALASEASGCGVLEEIMCSEPTPEFAAQVAEECRLLLTRLPNEELRSVALWKMEGWTNEEIAAQLQCVPRSVERKLRLIRELWSGAAPPTS